MDGEEEEDCLVEEREENMVVFTGSKEPIQRNGWFLKPNPISTHESLSPPFPPPRYEIISIGTHEVPKVQFKGWMSPQRQWGQWVDKLKPIYKDLWVKVGIFDAIKASTYKIRRKPSSIWGVVGFWCEETNTFLFPWSEATLTLEDMMVLGGFPVLGEPVRASGPLEGELGEIESKMISEIKRFNRSKCKKADHCEWISHYMEGEGDELEHIAFLSLWLSRFVFPSRPLKTVARYVIPIAIRLCRGVRIALAPAVLASLYRDLRAMKDHLTSCGASPLIVWAPFNILQLWVWERFISLMPEFQNFVNSDEPRAARWHNVDKKLELSFVLSVLESPDEFRWRPYTTDLNHWYKPSFYKDDGRWVCGNSVGDEGLGSFDRCLRACELVGLDCIEQYLPHRVAMQFGLDQDIPISVSRANSTWEMAWQTYDISAKNVKFYVPSRIFESDVTLQYSIWWENVKGFLKKKIVEKKRNNTRPPPNSKKKKVQDLNDITLSDWPLPNIKKKKVQNFNETTLSDWLALRNHGINSNSTRHLPTSKKKKMQYCNDTTLSGWIAHRNYGIRRKSMGVKSQEPHTCAMKPKKHVNLKLSLKCSEETNQNSDASRETKVENGKQLQEEFVSDQMDIKDKGIVTDVKSTNAGESAYDSIVTEEPEDKFKMEEMEESTAEKDKVLDLELEIKKLKEEIASIQARVMDLESLAEVHTQPELVSSIS